MSLNTARLNYLYIFFITTSLIKTAYNIKTKFRFLISSYASRLKHRIQTVSPISPGRLSENNTALNSLTWPLTSSLMTKDFSLASLTASRLGHSDCVTTRPWVLSTRWKQHTRRTLSFIFSRRFLCQGPVKKPACNTSSRLLICIHQVVNGYCFFFS